MVTRRVLIVAVISAVVGASWAAPPDAVGALPDPAGTQTSAAGASTPQFGAWAEPVLGENRTGAAQNLEALLGSDLGVVSNYLSWDSSFPTEFDNWVRDSGHRLMLAVKLKNSDGSRPRWRDLADARPGDPLDQQLRAWAVAVRQFGAPLYFAFHKEPEEPANIVNGNAADFQAAWQRVVSVFRAEGATNAEFVFDMTDNAYALSSADRRSVSNWYPGDAYVDHIGASGMNWFGCKGQWPSWRSFEQIYDPMRRWAVAHPDKGLIAFEFGSVEDPQQPGRKATWLNDARQLLTRPEWDRFVAHAYYNGGSSQAPECNWRLDTSESSRVAASSWASAITSIQLPTVQLAAPTVTEVATKETLVATASLSNGTAIPNNYPVSLLVAVDGRNYYYVARTSSGRATFTLNLPDSAANKTGWVKATTPVSTYPAAAAQGKYIKIIK